MKDWPKKRSECRHPTSKLVLQRKEKSRRVCCKDCGRYWEIDRDHFDFYQKIGVPEGEHTPQTQGDMLV